MHPTLCSRCKKNIAVIFITKIEAGKTVSDGLCLKCAKEMGLKPVDDIMKRMGISEDDLDGINNEMTEAFQGMESMMATEQPQDENDDPEEIESQTATFPFLNKLFGGERQEETPAEAPGNPRGGEPEKHERSPKQKKHKFLDTYCLNLTQKARAGGLDRVVGREVETERVIQILNRRQKNNPCLIGEPGVGKTAIAEGLAQRIVNGDVPYKLQDKEVYLLDLTSLVAGTQFRGQFESRMKGLIEEIKKLGNIILVIDEVHNLVGAGDAEGSMNAANILKPALSRGEIQVIGATTFNEYRKYIEKDSALERRFQPVTVNEPTIEEAVDIIRGIAHYYEEFHGVVVSPEIARQAVVLSERYITDRFLPDKAIDLLDEACSDVNLKNKNISKLMRLKKEHADLDLELSMLTEKAEEADYERMAAIRSRNLQLDKEIALLEEEPKPALTVENLARIIELWTKIPASKIKAQEYDQLRELETRLKKRIVGQDEAISAVAAAIRRGRVGISPKKRPVSFIFVGPTGVGKTELVKCLADDLFDSVETLIRLDMSEYMEKHSVSKLIGSPPGYVGYDEAGQLTEKIRRKPYSVILFDELEKAHPDVLNILLQILDDGRITDAQGRVVNFENTIIIMTSNAGSDRKESSVGFGRTLSEQNKEKTMKALQAFLRPEFINRVDEVVTFRNLTEENFRDIAAIMLGELKTSLDGRGIALSWDESLVDFLVKEAYSITYGARNLRRTIQKHVEDPIAEKIIDSCFEPIRAISLTAQDGAVKLETK
ncbi:MAG TPA: ATP-dependent Clp protease ATP-binding subunit [Candidatus Avoscillospira stercoripullorum]|uniref:ATP-dependent Clp protease ATP-binding subunit n=1 Tax=Candidatus Avoscillospira stercoripullorum TaxID=2840709 RepID=A0A9D1A736_9FIRM|nr:ATP-dependent Clp protease ATP-binding subunit [Candidatus Avoscillospira stercoripullorum]